MIPEKRMDMINRRLSAIAAACRFVDGQEPGCTAPEKAVAAVRAACYFAAAGIVAAMPEHLQTDEMMLSLGEAAYDFMADRLRDMAPMES
jgi:hypothetical protein